MRITKQIERIRKAIKHFRVKKLISRNEKTYKNKLKYLYLSRKSDCLLIVFSGFTGEIRKYNYISSFMDLPVNQLYILDTWGELGSYYWYENGLSYPEITVSALIEDIKEKNNIKKIITAGTSKGGSAAIYFGIKHKVDSIYSGACQYRVGTYLNRPEHIEILKAMMGDMDKTDAIQVLDKKIEDILRDVKDDRSNLFLFYSTKELTYERQIAPLIKDLEELQYPYTKAVNNFQKHEDVGIYFPEYLITSLESIL